MSAAAVKARQAVDPTWEAFEEKVPLERCPPIFEGEKWMDEAIVVHNRIVKYKEAMAEGGKSPHDGCVWIMKKLMGHESAYPFNTPVDVEELNIPEYYEVVKRPMDLGTAKAKLLAGEYSTLREFYGDVYQTFGNAKLFNPPRHPVHTMASALCTQFNKEVRYLLAKWRHLLPPGGPHGQDFMGLRLITDGPELEGKASDDWPGAGALLAMSHEDGGRPKRGQSDTSRVSSRRNSVPSSSVIGKDWEVVSVSMSKVRLQVRKKEAATDDLDNMARHQADIVLPRQRKAPPLTAEQRLTLPAQVAKIIEKDRKDFLVVVLCPPGAEGPVPDEAEGKKRKAKRRRTAGGSPISVKKAATMPHGELRADDGDARGNCALEKLGAPNAVKSEPYDEEEKAGDASTGKGVAQPDSSDIGAQASTGPPQGSRGSCEAAYQGVRTAASPIITAVLGGNEGPEVTDEKEPPQVESSGLLVFSGGLHVNSIFNSYLSNAPLPCSEKLKDTHDPDGLVSRPFVDSRHNFLELCQWRNYQFDTLRRAKHASAMTLYHLHNSNPEDNSGHAPHCVQCKKRIREVRWHCTVCPDFELCQDCNTHDINNDRRHEHLLTPYLVHYMCSIPVEKSSVEKTI